MRTAILLVRLCVACHATGEAVCLAFHARSEAVYEACHATSKAVCEAMCVCVCVVVRQARHPLSVSHCRHFVQLSAVVLVTAVCNRG